MSIIEPHKHEVRSVVGLFVQINGTLGPPTRRYKHQDGNSQSPSYKHWFNINSYELHQQRSCDSVIDDLVIVKAAVSVSLLGFEPITLYLLVNLIITCIIKW